MAKKNISICFVSSEITPFAKTGGLADVSGALGKYIGKLGHDICLVMPLYSSIDLYKYDFHKVDFAQHCEIHFGPRTLYYDIWAAKLPDSDTNVYFVHCPEMYTRGSLYTDDADESIRFALLSRAAIELCQRMNWSPDIFHINDWQTALTPVYLKTLYAWDGLFRNTKTIITIHNIGYQGQFPGGTINDLHLSAYHNYFDAHDLYHGNLNFLKTGLMQSDKIITVSPTYAREIQTAEYGEMLDGILRMRSGDLSGILNGVDYEEWNPETDKLIPFNYSPKALSGKTKNKKSLLGRLGLIYKKDVPLVGMITRLVNQKGLDLFESVVDSVLAKYDMRLVVLGSGDEEYEQYFYYLQLNFPDKVVFYQGYDYPLSHQIEAGSDIFLMPSKYEPCGLNQIYSLKYGTVPIVRKTGGLADTVEAYNWKSQMGTGFVFEDYSKEGFRWAIEAAIKTYEHKQAWMKLVKRAMKKDFSWDKQVPEYLQIYNKLIKS